MQENAGMGKKTGHNGGGKLRPFTSENSEDMGRRGGIATGEARRRRRQPWLPAG